MAKLQRVKGEYAGSVCAGANSVLVAPEIQVAAFSPIWFQKAGILEESELEGEVIFTPAFIQIVTADFQLVVAPNRVQLNFTHFVPDKNAAHTSRILGGIVKALPHIPFTGYGTNFQFVMDPHESERFERWSIDRFSSGVALALTEEARRPRFGTYFSQNFEIFREKVTIMPISVNDVEDVGGGEMLEVGEYMKVDFNFHFDVDSENTVSAVPAIDASLKCHSEAVSVMRKLMDYED